MVHIIRTFMVAGEEEAVVAMGAVPRLLKASILTNAFARMMVGLNVPLILHVRQLAHSSFIL